MTQTSIPAPRVRATLARIRDNIGRTIKGKDSVIEQILICLLSRGHVLLEDLPGLGKTTLAYCLARSLDVGFARIQFTSDLLPSDVLGVSIYDERERQFVFRKGPVFTNILLADEINRTTPKTQSALLEVMDRGKVSVEGETLAVGNPFMVFATQNPVDYEGAFPLPESQMDRFLMRLQVGYPEFDDELAILQRGARHYDTIESEPVISAADLLEMQEMVPQVYVEDSVLHYMLRIVTATRTETEFRSGVSTRGTLALKVASQATALASGRTFVIPEDVIRSVGPVFTHRLELRRQTSDTLEERRAVEGILHSMIDSVAPPSV
jgi:MoxR-like ATPase